jgi:hypothetical protein
VFVVVISPDQPRRGEAAHHVLLTGDWGGLRWAGGIVPSISLFRALGGQDALNEQTHSSTKVGSSHPILTMSAADNDLQMLHASALAALPVRPWRTRAQSWCVPPVEAERRNAMSANSIPVPRQGSSPSGVHLLTWARLPGHPTGVFILSKAWRPMQLRDRRIQPISLGIHGPVRCPLPRGLRRVRTGPVPV